MVHDPITEEIREIRHRLAAQCDNDVYRIGEDLRRRQAASGRKVVRLPKREPRVNNLEQRAARGSKKKYHAVLAKVPRVGPDDNDKLKAEAE